jgi:hypothetical protein
MTSRPTDPRGAARRGNDNSDIGYGVANDASRPVAAIRFSPPADIHGITRYMRQRQATGLCVVCGKPAPMAGATCKSPGCVRAWVFGGR